MAQFDYLGSLKEWLSKEYTFYKIIILESDYKESNIPVFISTAEQVGLRIFCTKDLSNSIRNNERSIEQLNENIIIKVTREDGTSFIRLSDVVYDVRI